MIDGQSGASFGEAVIHTTVMSWDVSHRHIHDDHGERARTMPLRGVFVESGGGADGR